MSATTSHHVHATLAYYQPKADGTGPDLDDLAIILGPKDMDCREAAIHDMRGEEDNYRLEDHGFQIVKHVSSMEDFSEESRIKSVYYPEIEELLLKSTSARKVIFFNHMIRSGPSPLVEKNPVLSPIAGPAPRVHVDQTAKGALQALFRILPHDEATEINSHRWQIVNAWRPLKTIQKDPLAIADATSVPLSDLVPIPRMYGDKEGENCAVKADGFAQHKWYYLYEQKPSEVLLFKQHDSDPDAQCRGSAHSSFPYPGTEHLENRRSIEVRAIVCY